MNKTETSPKSSLLTPEQIRAALQILFSPEWGQPKEPKSKGMSDEGHQESK